MNGIKRIAIIISLTLFSINLSVAQSVDYDQAMDDIMSTYLSDYPDPTIKSLDRLFDGVDIESLPAEIKFLYYYYIGICYADANRVDDAIISLVKAREIAYSNFEIGIRNIYAIDAEFQLAELHKMKGTEEHRATALLLYNDVITVGISLIEDPDIG